jgi:hypothetical protein
VRDDDDEDDENDDDSTRPIRNPCILICKWHTAVSCYI